MDDLKPIETDLRQLADTGAVDLGLGASSHLARLLPLHHALDRGTPSRLELRDEMAFRIARDYS